MLFSTRGHEKVMQEQEEEALTALIMRQPEKKRLEVHIT